VVGGHLEPFRPRGDPLHLPAEAQPGPPGPGRVGAMAQLGVDVDHSVPAQVQPFGRPQPGDGGAGAPGRLQPEGPGLLGQGPGAPRLGPQQVSAGGAHEPGLHEPVPALHREGGVLGPPGEAAGDAGVVPAGVEPRADLPVHQDHPALAGPGQMAGGGQPRDAATNYKYFNKSFVHARLPAQSASLDGIRGGG
jgi:hypothetical protein